MEQDEFFLKVSTALSGCQMVEFELKLYLTNAVALIKKRLGERIFFGMSGSDFDNSSLEGLIKHFKKFSDNRELISRLNSFKNERNFLSHKAIAICMHQHEGYQQWQAASLDDRLNKINIEALSLFNDIHNESAKFLGYLWFEDEI
ncbi:hypothetical protein D172_020090 (plasmid) [Pseudoalteromonas sp. Bsw20308]|uniref:hypothetical protein n=1 Tax=Pseudoalteromonas sp. Bsw20308 TaxID=283699 RepID=UPI00051944E5|nr:hypothetical protein [Pseudoalteromonas sp. Bsw20308]ALQ10370.1 hypothetical protein D172_020090 [Pseudoalteromonas sp. Bsw20308]